MAHTLSVDLPALFMAMIVMCFGHALLYTVDVDHICSITSHNKKSKMKKASSCLSTEMFFIVPTETCVSG